MTVLGKLFGHGRGTPASSTRTPSKGDLAYARAMNESDELIEYMRSNSSSSDPARAVMADIWRQNNNVPFMVTIVETVEELKSPIEQRASDKSTPKSG